MHFPNSKYFTSAAVLSLVTIAVLAWLGFDRTVSAGASTIAVGEIRPGMKGYGLTVFAGTEPERFDVEVIDVVP